MQPPPSEPAPRTGAAIVRSPKAHQDCRCFVAFRPAADEGRQERRAALDEIGSISFENCLPYRQPHPYRGQRNIPGLYFFATTQEHVTFERRILERRTLVMLDFDPEVTGVVARPFALYFRGSWHMPDFLVRTYDGRDRLVDVVEKRNAPGYVEAIAAACEHADWSYEAAHYDLVKYANVEWLSGFRRYLSSPELRRLADEILDVVAAGAITIGDLISSGSPDRSPVLLRPILYHLMWHHELEADLHQVLSDSTVIHRPPEYSRRTSRRCFQNDGKVYP